MCVGGWRLPDHRCMQRTLRATSPAALLRMIPYIAGRGLRRSAVVLPLAGTSTSMALRVDLPRVGDADARIWARSLVASVLPSAGSIAIALYSDELIGTGKLPARDVAAALQSEADAAGIRIRALLCQAQDAWGDYAEPDRAQGPLAELAAERCEAGPFLAPSEPRGAPIAAGAEARREVAAAISALQAERSESNTIRSDASRLGAALADPVVPIERALCSGLPLDHADAALLIAVIQPPGVRDAATVQLLDGLRAGVLAHRAQREFEHLGTASTDLVASADRLFGRGPAPDSERLERATALIDHLASVAADSFQPSLLTMLATLHWCAGRSSAASRCVERALEIDADYGMALLVRQILDAQLLPEWVERHRTIA